jgi:hypothetical protein
VTKVKNGKKEQTKLKYGVISAGRNGFKNLEFRQVHTDAKESPQQDLKFSVPRKLS